MQGTFRVGCGWRAVGLALWAQLLAFGAVAGQAHAGGHKGLEFSHPLIAESISPDTKVRLELDRATAPGVADLVVEGEYAFVPAFSLEMGLPVEHAAGGVTDAFPGPVEARAKWVRYLGSAAAIGGGATFELPTQSAQLSSGGGRQYGMEPFIDGGLRSGAWEWVAFGRLGLVTSPGPEDASATLGYNASALYKPSAGLHVLAELDGGMPLDGGAEGEASLAVSPGVEIWPGLGPHVMFGAALSLPLLSHREYEHQLSVSAFYHF